MIKPKPINSSYAPFASQHMDLDGDGYITEEELQQALATDIPDAQQLQDAVREALQDADKDNDGRIDYMVRAVTTTWLK